MGFGGERSQRQDSKARSRTVVLETRGYIYTGGKKELQPNVHQKHRSVSSTTSTRTTPQMSSYPQSSYSPFLFPNTQHSSSSPPHIEDNYYSSVPVEIPCARDRNLLTAHSSAYSPDDYLVATPLASPPDFYLDSQHETVWSSSHQQDIASVLFGQANDFDAVAPPRYPHAGGLEPAAVLSSSWPGDPGAADGGSVSLDTTPGSLSTSQSDLGGGLPLETPPSDLDGGGGDDVFSPFLSPYLQPQRYWYDTLPPCNSPHNPHNAGNEMQLFDPVTYSPPDTDPASHVPKSDPQDKCGILALLMANPAMWRQATLSKKGTYVCSHCTSQGNHRKFSNLAALAAHFDQHQVLRLCKCDYSSCVWSLIGFSSMPEKVRHLRSQHSNKHYKCGACQRAFLRGDSLKRHLRLVHGREHTSAAEINEMTVMRPFQSANESASANASTGSNCKSTASTFEPVFEFLSLTP